MCLVGWLYSLSLSLTHLSAAAGVDRDDDKEDGGGGGGGGDEHVGVKRFDNTFAFTCRYVLHVLEFRRRW